ncbi:hypothetical protein CAPTEDRAFT_198299 [Capitella teleta]|uniref:Caspase family p20 domain-containing protein n=1 Tax=Capitella teleta TaxID=283909 RepID=R7U9S7_CAPTE|nr:hypothetical protein CAPTEDRAFT_198299 [Capitella teleta]|eukprot:ELU03115.1 hypothetical protein CAPTEDRAFT_198299 [Capitella teleta]
MEPVWSISSGHQGMPKEKSKKRRPASPPVRPPRAAALLTNVIPDELVDDQCDKIWACIKDRLPAAMTKKKSQASVYQRQSTQKIDESWKTDSRSKTKKMLCLMIVNYTFDTKGSRLTPSYRSGALNQAMELKSTLEDNCSCQVVLKENLKVGKMQTAIDDLVRGQLVLDNGTKANLADFDNVWLVLSSHGDWETFPNNDKPTHQADVIWGTDDTVPIHLLTKQLQKTGKPCAIVSQACRGDQFAAVGVMEFDKHGNAVSYEEAKPTFCGSDRQRAESNLQEYNSYLDNQIMLCSSLPGDISFRSPLLNALMRVLNEEDLCTADVQTLFAKACSKVQEYFTSRSNQSVLNNRKVSAIYNDKLLSKMYLK